VKIKGFGSFPVRAFGIVEGGSSQEEVQKAHIPIGNNSA
jgi:hypothetical protein